MSRVSVSIIFSFLTGMFHFKNRKFSPAFSALINTLSKHCQCRQWQSKNGETKQTEWTTVVAVNNTTQIPLLPWQQTHKVPLPLTPPALYSRLLLTHTLIIISKHFLCLDNNNGNDGDNIDEEEAELEERERASEAHHHQLLSCHTKLQQQPYGFTITVH